jgi:hypothetical protein
VSTIFFGLGGKIMSIKLNRPKPYVTYAEDGGDALTITYRNNDYLNLTITARNGPSVNVVMSKNDTKHFINYLQNWLETGNFEGEGGSGEEIDADGVAWDPKKHSPLKRKTKRGTWKLRRSFIAAQKERNEQNDS